MRMSHVKFATCSEVKVEVENRNNTPAIPSGFQTENAMDYWSSNPDFLGLCSGFTVSRGRRGFCHHRVVWCQPGINHNVRTNVGDDSTMHRYCSD